MAEKTILDPATDRVLVIDNARDTTIDGITLPENVKQQEMVYGTVVCVGPAAQATTHPKDIVCYGPYAGKPAVLDGVEFRIIREEHIEAYVRTVEAEGQVV